MLDNPYIHLSFTNVIRNQQLKSQDLHQNPIIQVSQIKISSHVPSIYILFPHKKTRRPNTTHTHTRKSNTLGNSLSQPPIQPGEYMIRYKSRLKKHWNNVSSRSYLKNNFPPRICHLSILLISKLAVRVFITKGYGWSFCAFRPDGFLASSQLEFDFSLQMLIYSCLHFLVFLRKTICSAPFSESITRKCTNYDKTILRCVIIPSTETRAQKPPS